MINCHFTLFQDSLLFENPFRDGGKLSRDAEDIVIAIRTGKLSVASNSQDHLQETANPNDTQEEDEKNTSINIEQHTPTKSSLGSPSSPLVKPCNRKNAVIENSKTSETKVVTEKNLSNSKKQNQKCCTVSWLHLYFKCSMYTQTKCKIPQCTKWKVSISLLPYLCLVNSFTLFYDFYIQ